MFSLSPIDWRDALILAGTCLGMAGISHYYNEWIDRLVDVDPLGNHGALLTSLWLFYTLPGLFIVLSVLFNWIPAVFVTFLLVVSMVASGLPLVLGDMRRGWRRRNAAKLNTSSTPTEMSVYELIDE